MPPKSASIAIFATALLLQLQNACPGLAAGPRIETFAGTGEKGFSGDGGPAKSAHLNNVFGITRGPDGALYLCDTDNQRVRRIGRDGTITTVAGSGTRGYSGDGGPATKAELNEPYEVRFDKAGDLYFVERLNHVVRKLSLKTGISSTVAGKGKPGFGGDGGPATQAMFNEPHSIQFDGSGDLLVCDIRNHRLRKIALETKIITTFGGTGEGKPTPEGAAVGGDVPLNGPRALDVDRDGNVWLALREGNAVYRIGARDREVHRIAGTGKKGYTGDGGPAREATLSGPKGIAVAPSGDVYVADTENHVVRRIDVKRGTIETVVGTGQRGDGPDGGPLHCKLARPHSVFVDADGTLFIGDSENNRLRVLQDGK